MSTFQPRPATAGRLPGHTAINLGLALAIWAGGCFFTAQVLPVGGSLGPFVPFALAVVLQLLLSAAQMNLRTHGVTSGRWPFAIMVGLDVLINLAGLLILYVPGVATLADAALFVLSAGLTGSGLWQCAGALLVALLIAFAPEQMVRDALN
jgi:hypothetical protein